MKRVPHEALGFRPRNICRVGSYLVMRHLRNRCDFLRGLREPILSSKYNKIRMEKIKNVALVLQPCLWRTSCNVMKEG